jgi:hypothetical protein
MGIAVFYDDGGVCIDSESEPQRTTETGRMGIHKVYCVHLINSMGYDLLFQDIDLVWYENPLGYFETTLLEEFDAGTTEERTTQRDSPL